MVDIGLRLVFIESLIDDGFYYIISLRKSIPHTEFVTSTHANSATICPNSDEPSLGKRSSDEPSNRR